MIRRLKSAMRHGLVDPARYRWHEVRSTVERARGGGGPAVRVLLASDGREFTSEQQLAPILRHADALRTRLGVLVRFMRLADALELPGAALRRFDVVGIKLSFRTPAADAARVARSFRGELGAAPTKLVCFDGDDDLCVQWPEVLRVVDAVVKKHVFRDPRDYGRARLGRTNLTDWVARADPSAFGGRIETREGLPPDDIAKIHLGWNIALDDAIATLAAGPPPPDDAKDLDIVCRAAVPADWIAALRRPVLAPLDAAASRWKVLTPRDRVSREQYYDELRRSRICVSPFGYGEVCWRDFEAILCGCLVVKPDVGHLRTAPDVFVPSDTYVPVRWDYSDLLDTCERYLRDDAARRRITERARAALVAALRPDAFTATFGALLQRLGLPAPGARWRGPAERGAGTLDRRPEP